MTDVVADGLVVLFKYKLTDSDGNVIDASEDDPTPYLHGAENIVPGLEREMTGKKVGDSFAVTVAPADGYGEYEDGLSRRVERDAFPEDVEVGDMLVLEGDDGSSVPIWVTEIDEDSVEFDMNHPLAGEALHFEITITRIRAATQDELAHGHPHGPDGTSGHHHH